MASGDFDVVVVGAGSAGIAAARRLGEARPDLTVQVLEASARIGGRACTVTTAPGFPVDLGCGWLHGAKDNAWAHIAKRIGFAIDTSLSSWDGAGRDYGLNATDATAAMQAMRAFFRRADARDEHKPDVPLAQALEAGNRWNGLMEAIGTFINGTELEHASLRDYQRYAPGRGPDTRVLDGYGRLVETYAAGLPIACETVVRLIDHSAPRIRVETDRGTLSARAVIVTVSTTVLAREAIRFTPALPAMLAAASRLPLGLANKLFLGLREPNAFEPEGHILGSAGRSRTAGYHIRPFGRPVIECYFGGALARDLERAGEAATVAFAKDELSAHWGPAAVHDLWPLASSAWLGAPHVGGAYSYAEPGAWGQRAALATPVDERIFFAGEACAPHRFSTAHGAFETGVAAADRIRSALA